MSEKSIEEQLKAIKRVMNNPRFSEDFDADMRFPFGKHKGKYISEIVKTNRLYAEHLLSGEMIEKYPKIVESIEYFLKK